MPKNPTLFKKGNPGKPFGANSQNKERKALLGKLFTACFEDIMADFSELTTNNKIYLMTSILPYIVTKEVEEVITIDTVGTKQVMTIGGKDVEFY